MTLLEAKNNWKISEKRLLEWIDKGFIPEIEIQNGKIFIGEKKPFIPNRGTNITVENVRKYILTACNNLEYIDYRIFCITPEQFKEILLQLEDNNYIRRNIPNADCLSNRNFAITEQGESALKKGKFKLDRLSFTLKFDYLNVNVDFTKSEDKNGK